MPTGTRNSISTNSATNPRTATASLVIASLDRLDLILGAEFVRLEDQPVSANGDQQHGRDVAEPGDQEKRPDRQAQIEGKNVIGARGPNLVVERVGLHRDDEQENERSEHVDDALQARADIGVEQVHGDVGAAITRGGDAPEDQNAEQQPAEVVGIGNLHAEEVAQHDRDEDVGGDDADET